MTCAACGKENRPGARFCRQCGAEIATTCPDCGTEVEPGDQFCDACGHGLTATTPSTKPPSPAAVAVGGEKKQITVLFADVAGSMDLQERLDAEVWAAIMGRFVSILAEGVRRFGGTVDKFTGDGIMALFGAPVAQEDHARRACHAAWELTKAIGEYSEELRKDQGVELHVRLGLNSGEVVVGRVGDDVTIDPTALGHTVGLAQRMEAMAEPGQVYLTGATAQLVTGYFELQNLGATEVKGAHEPIHVCSLVGPGALRTPLEVSAVRGLTRFVGRDRELAALEAALVDATRGSSRVVGIVAEPGLGKSRLCHEFAQRCRDRGVDVFAAHALAHTRTVPFVPVLEMLRAVFGVEEHDDPATARAKLAADVTDLDSDLVGALPLLYDFLGVADPDAPAPTMDPEARQRQIFATLNRLRRARSARRPYVMLVEDLHWLDPGSEAFLENLVNSTPGTRVLVVTTCRPEYRAPWAHRAHYAQLPLGPLLDEATGELLRDLLGEHASLDGVAEIVRERTGGNPFFIEEVVHDLVEEGSLEGRRGAYQLVRTIDEVRVPPTINAVLAARIDRLGGQAKAILQTAAVIGRQFSARLVGVVTGLAVNELDTAVRSLVETELIYETSAYPEQEYAFKHALVEEVAYASQLAPRRTTIHADVARALTTTHDDKLDERAALIAHHYELGGDLLEAARWNARAAAWAGTSHPFEAARHWRRARTLTDHLEPSGEAGELAMEARCQLLGYFIRLGAAGEDGGVPWEEEAHQIFVETEARALASGQPYLRAIVTAAYAGAQMLSDQVRQGCETGLEATRLADEVGDPAVRSVARGILDWGLFVLGHVPEALEVTREMEAIIGDDRSVARGVMAASMYAYCQLHLAQFGHHCGRLNEGLLALEQVVEIAGLEGDLEIQAWAHRNWVICADWAGADPVAASIHAAAALDLAEASGSPWSRVYVREGVAASHAYRGEWDRAIAVVDEALAIARGRRIGYASVPLLLSLRARAQLGQDDVSGARTSAGEAVESAVTVGTRFYEAQARHQLGRALLASQQSESARHELHRALSIVEALGISAYAPQIHEDLARASLAAGELAAYENELRTAHRCFLGVGAAGHAGRVEAELGARRVR